MFDFPRSFLFCKDLWGREKSNWLLRKKISHPGFCQGGRFVICREKVFSCLFCFVDMLKPIVTAQCLTGRTASSAGTQCLSRLRRAHSAFRAYGGHTVPFAPTAGTQCLSRLRRAHSASRAYGGHTVPLAPTASPKEANCEEFAFRSISGKPYRSKKNHLKTGSHPSASAVKKKSIE